MLSNRIGIRGRINGGMAMLVLLALVLAVLGVRQSGVVDARIARMSMLTDMGAGSRSPGGT